ncbi:hypothetical protein ON010_g8576 [Phytophthora cinnamomi]|nr:hypothetical protein ON010_g8576 [Phytophthora cinnamomi]
MKTGHYKGASSANSRIRIEIDQETNDRVPETPTDVMNCNDPQFRNLIETHKARLTAAYGPTASHDIWKQRHDMIERYKVDTSFHRRVDSVDRSSFLDAWSDVDCEGNYRLLFAFVAGVAVISPGSHSVESEFSVLKQVKNPQRTALTNYASGGQLQSLQYFFFARYS